MQSKKTTFSTNDVLELLDSVSRGVLLLAVGFSRKIASKMAIVVFSFAIRWRVVSVGVIEGKES